MKRFLGVTCGLLIAASAQAETFCSAPIEHKFSSPGWELDIKADAKHHVRRITTSNQADETLTIEHVVGTSKSKLLLKLPENRFHTFSESHGLMLRFDGGDVISTSSNNQFADLVRIQEDTATIYNWVDFFKDHEHAKSLEIRWVNSADEERISHFALGRYCRALTQLQTSLDGISHLLP